MSLGIIDQTLLLDHPEYRERIAFYEEIDAHEHPQLHGAARRAREQGVFVVSSVVLGGRELSLGPIVNPAGLITAVQAK